MTFFSPVFVQALIVGALILTTAGAVMLIVLLVFDFKNKNVW